MNTLVDQLSGPDLAYWVARANLNESPQDINVLRSHYGQSVTHELMDEPHIREFVKSKLGNSLPPRDVWQ